MMREALNSDWVLQGVMLLVALAFALFMRFAVRYNSHFVTLLFQGLIIVSAIVVVGAALNPGLLASSINQRYIMVIPAMMTLIYAVRDVFTDFSSKDKFPR